MREIEKTYKNRSLTNALIFLGALLFCISVSLYALNDIKYNHYNERVNSTNVVMSKIGNHMNTAFANKWEKVSRTKIRIERLENQSTDDMIKTLDDIYEEAQVNYAVVDENGIAYDRGGKVGYWKDYGKLHPGGDSFLLSEPQLGVTEEKKMHYIAGYQKPVTVDDIKIQYVVMTEDMSSIQNTFDISNYGKNCLSFIMMKNGVFVYDNGTDDIMSESYNLLEFLRKNIEFEYGKSFEHFSNDIKNNVNNTVLIKYHNENYYLSYYHLSMAGWISLMFVPEKNIESGGMHFTQRITIDIVYVFATAIILFCAGFFYMWRNTIIKQRYAMGAEKAANDAKTNFLSSMSHDIRTPMNAIMGMTEIGLHNPDDNKQMRESLKKINLASTHLLTLINDILDISKIESGKMTLNISEFSIVNALNTLISMIRSEISEKHLDFRAHAYHIEQENIQGDELRLNQVCINLLTNAIKYTEYGGRVDFDIWQEAFADDPDKIRIKCIVRDTGIGISEEYQKVMYDSFSRGTDSRVNEISGSGLGLTICKQMVTLMNGTIECDSERGKGTVFTFTAEFKRGKKDEVYELPALNILMVDSDPVSLEAMSKILERLGVEADFVINDDDCPQSLLKCKSKKYDMAFVELGLPEKKGIEAVAIIRRQFGNDIPIILTDIADMTFYTEDIRNIGIQYVKNKPFFYSEIYQIINKVLNAKESCQAASNELSWKSDGMKLLVAEDNDVNWEIIELILNMNGIASDRAKNGQDCINMLENADGEQYSAVLMDVRMPILDGREATKIIRKSKKDNVRNIPVIAMTADAFAEDIQSCLDAGMNEHLAKPLDTKKLLAVLEKVHKNVPVFLG